MSLETFNVYRVKCDHPGGCGNSKELKVPAGTLDKLGAKCVFVEQHGWQIGKFGSLCPDHRTFHRY